MEQTLNKRINNKGITENYNTLDLLKFFLAILVFTGHMPPFPNDFIIHDGGKFLNFFITKGFCRTAVPFYFTASGFFLFKKMPINALNSERVKSYCIKTFKLLGVWSFLLFFGKTVHLWYLGALVIAVIVLYFLLKKNLSILKITIIAGTLYFVGLFGDAYYSFLNPLKNIKIFDYFIYAYDKTFETTRNGIFMGLLFVFIGYLFAHKKIKISLKLSILGLIVSLGMLCAEIFILRSVGRPKDYNLLLSVIPVNIFLFNIAIKFNIKSKSNSSLFVRLRVVGVLIFFSHLLVIEFMLSAMKLLKNTLGINLFPVKYPIALVLAIAFAVFLEWLSRQRKFTWLKHLYT